MGDPLSVFVTFEAPESEVMELNSVIIIFMPVYVESLDGLMNWTLYLKT